MTSNFQFIRSCCTKIKSLAAPCDSHVVSKLDSQVVSKLDNIIDSLIFLADLVKILIFSKLFLGTLPPQFIPSQFLNIGSHQKRRPRSFSALPFPAQKSYSELHRTDRYQRLVSLHQVLRFAFTFDPLLTNYSTGFPSESLVVIQILDMLYHC